MQARSCLLPLGILACMGLGALLLGFWYLECRGPLMETDGCWSGWSAMWVGDVDGDGTPDFFVATPFELTDAGWGSVRIMSGRTKRCLHVLDGVHQARAHWGSIGPAGDADGDGYADFIIEHTDDRGREIHSGKTGLLVGDPARARSPQTIWNLDKIDLPLSIGDYDEDGMNDAISHEDGVLQFISGKTGKPESWIKEYPVHWMLVGDIDGDGIGDIGALRWEDNSILSGKTGKLIRKVEGAMLSQGCGDLDHDSYDDLLVAFNEVSKKRCWDRSIWNRGRVEVWSGKDGTVLLTINGTDLPPVQDR